jgi:hypothetical protein
VAESVEVVFVKGKEGGGEKCGGCIRDIKRGQAEYRGGGRGGDRTVLVLGFGLRRGVLLLTC